MLTAVKSEEKSFIIKRVNNNERFGNGSEESIRERS